MLESWIPQEQGSWQILDKPPQFLHGTPFLVGVLYFFLPPKPASDWAEILKPLQSQLIHPFPLKFSLHHHSSHHLSWLPSTAVKFETWRMEEESRWDLLLSLLAKVLCSPTILKTCHTRHQTPSTHSPGETAFLHTSSAKSFSWKSREYTNRFPLTFCCTYFLLSSKLDCRIG